MNIRNPVLRNYLQLHLVILLGGLASVVVARLESMFGGFYCLMHAVLHLYCPLCGGTRAVGALLHGQIVSAIIYNPYVIIGGAILAAFDLRALYRLWRYRGAVPLFPPSLPIWYLVIAVLFCVARNVLCYAVGYDPLGDFRP